MAIQGGPTYRLSEQPWAQPGEICLGETPPVSHCNSSILAQHMLKGTSMFFFPSPLLPSLLPCLPPFSAFSKDQRNSDGYLPGDEEQAAKHFTKHVLVLGQQRHRVHPFQACPGEFFLSAPFCCALCVNPSLCDSLLNNKRHTVPRSSLVM